MSSIFESGVKCGLVLAGPLVIVRIEVEVLVFQLGLRFLLPDHEIVAAVLEGDEAGPDIRRMAHGGNEAIASNSFAIAAQAVGCDPEHYIELA